MQHSISDEDKSAKVGDTVILPSGSMATCDYANAAYASLEYKNKNDGFHLSQEFIRNWCTVIPKL